MKEEEQKKVDESWKEQVEREKVTGPKTAPGQAAEGPAAQPEAQATTQPDAPRLRPGQEEVPQARFDLFLQGLVMEAFIALGDVPHPATRKQATALPQAKYLIDLLGVLEEKTRGNLTVDEDKLLREALYQLRMRYLQKAGTS